MLDRIESRFARYEPLRRAAGLMLGMLSGLDRKNCWTIAEHRGDLTPDGLQHVLARASWDAEAVRDDVRGYVLDAFADPDAVLIVDETGDVKKGVQVDPGTYPKPRPFGGMGNPIDQNGFSDHFPIGMRVTEAD